MSIDSSLKSSGNLTGHRNVLTRPERIERLLGRDKFNMESGTPTGLPKVGNRKAKAGKKVKKKAAEGEAVAGAPGAAPVAAAAPAAAPAKGAKPAGKPAGKGK